MIFRPIAELLSESVERKKEITTWEELLKLVDRDYYEHPLYIDADYQGFDERPLWNAESFLLGCKMPQYDTPQACGYLSENPNRLIGAPKVIVKAGFGNFGQLKIPE